MDLDKLIQMPSEADMTGATESITSWFDTFERNARCALEASHEDPGQTHEDPGQTHVLDTKEENSGSQVGVQVHVQVDGINDGKVQHVDNKLSKKVLAKLLTKAGIDTSGKSQPMLISILHDMIKANMTTDSVESTKLSKKLIKKLCLAAGFKIEVILMRELLTLCNNTSTD